MDRELATFRLDLLGVQDVVWGKGVTERPEDYMYLVYGNENHQLGTEFLVHQRNISVVKRADLVSERM